MDYKLIFNTKAYNKLCLYVANTDDEISGLGKVKKMENDFILIEDIILLEQESSSGGTKLDKEGLTKFYDGLMKKGENPSDWKLWWHSHADFSAFWSGTDKDTIESLDVEQDSNNWWLSIVMNRDVEMKARIDIFQPFRQTIDVEKWVFYNPFDEKLDEKIKKEIKKKVTKPVIVSNYPKDYSKEPYPDDRTGNWWEKKVDEMSKRQKKKSLNKLDKMMFKATSEKELVELEERYEIVAESLYGRGEPKDEPNDSTLDNDIEGNKGWLKS